MTFLSFWFLQQSHPGHKPALCTNTTLKVRPWNCGRNYHKPTLCTNTTLKVRLWKRGRNYHKPALCTNTTLKVRPWNCGRNYTALPPLEAQRWSQPANDVRWSPGAGTLSLPQWQQLPVCMSIIQHQHPLCTSIIQHPLSAQTRWSVPRRCPATESVEPSQSQNETSVCPEPAF